MKTVKILIEVLNHLNERDSWNVTITEDGDYKCFELPHAHEARDFLNLCETLMITPFWHNEKWYLTYKY